MKNIGQKLKDRRLELKVTINNISQELKIKKKYILALESEDIDLFDSRAYYNGYLKQYLKFLNVNTDLDNIREKQVLLMNIQKEDKFYPNIILIILSILCALISYHICDFLIG